MLLNLIKNTPWSSLKDYVSPSLFKVVPLSSLSKEALNLAKNVKSNRNQTIKKAQSNLLEKIKVDFDSFNQVDQLKTNDKKLLAEKILSIYFLEILQGPKLLLDIRLETFSIENKRIIWNPQSLFIEWDKKFSNSMINIYRGYYHGDDQLFQESLKELNLLACEDLFIKHFGFGNQTKVEFKQETFFNTFHEIFLRCRDKNIKLHQNFISLGLFLALLYESLEKLNINLDVRSIFFEVDKLVKSS